MTVKFTDAQLVALSAASQRDDRCLTPSSQLRGAVAAKFAEKLLAANLVIEIPVSKDMPVWRRDENDDAVALRLTDDGLAAIGVTEGGTLASTTTITSSDEGEVGLGSVEGAQTSSTDLTTATPDLNATANALIDENPSADSQETRQHAEAGARADRGPGAKAKTRTPRPETKLATLIAMLSRDAGATLDELTAALDWLPHTTRAAITGLRKRNYVVFLDKSDKARGSVYRIGKQSESEPLRSDLDRRDNQEEERLRDDSPADDDASSQLSHVDGIGEKSPPIGEVAALRAALTEPAV